MINNDYVREQWTITQKIADKGGLSFILFYHDPLWYQPFYLLRYKAHIHKLASNSFSEPVQLISKSHDLK